MSNRKKDDTNPVERIDAIEGRQQRLLSELDKLNELVEIALADFSPRREGVDC